MAIELQSKFSVNLGAVVNGALDAVKIVRNSERARKEAEFQRAVADGLSYEEQLALRQKQLEQAQAEGSPDTEFISKIEESIAQTKKLQRFNNYRTKYAATLGELSGGKINEVEYLDTLKGMLNGVEDPELRLEIQNDIAAAEGKVKLYNDTILENQVKKAKYDGTQKSLRDAINKVKAARSEAALNDNEDEVTALDETLSALQSQHSTVRIQDSLTDFQVRSSTRGTNPIEKLDFINQEIRSADNNMAIKIGDRTYESAEQFWTLERDGYLSGSSQIFGDFFRELETETKNVVAANSAKFGYPTQLVLDNTIKTFNDLKSRPEVAPFASKLDITQAAVMSESVDKLAKKINEVGTNNLTFKEADAQLIAAGAKYGIDTSSYRLDLDERLRNLARGGIIDTAEAVDMAPDVNVALPTVDGTKPKTIPTTTPGATPITPAPAAVNVGGNRTIKAGDTLSKIAAEAGTTVGELTRLNPELASNPDLIRVGQSIKLPETTTPTPEVTPTATPNIQATTPQSATTTSTPKTNIPPVTPAPKVETPQAPKPAPLQQTAPSQKYTGSSIVDFLSTKGQDTSFSARKKLAEEQGISNYTGTAEQNTTLLKKLNI